MAYPQQPNSMGQYGQPQQPKQQGGLPWWSYFSPFTLGLGASSRYGGKGENGTPGSNIWETLFGSQGGIGDIGGIQELLQMALEQYRNPHQGFEPIQQDIGNYFKNDILPHIQNQFNSQTGGHFSSGILGSNIARGTTSLADRLASAKAQYAQNQQQNALSAINAAKPQYFQQPGTEGIAGKAIDIGKNFLPFLI
jgi:hypothetical protein